MSQIERLESVELDPADITMHIGEDLEKVGAELDTLFSQEWVDVVTALEILDRVAMAVESTVNPVTQNI